MSDELGRYRTLAEHYECEWGKCATALNALAAENAALRAELAFARSTGDESALEYHALKERLAEAESAREVQDAALACLRNDLRECAIQRDTAEANLARLQERWDARPATEELEARLAEAEALLEIVAPLAYAQWKSGSCDPVEAVVGLNEPITGIADSADGVKG